MGITRRKFTSEFKTKVVLESLKERSSLQELASKFEVHPTQITEWKKQFLENSSAAFEKEAPGIKKEETEKQMEQLYAQIGQLKVENDWLKKKLR